jgi:hypothetical protein
MFYQNGRITAIACMLFLMFLLAACSFTDNTANTNNNNNTKNEIVTVTTYQGTPPSQATPVVVKAKSVQGSSQGSSSGPIVVAAPTHVAGNSANSTQAVLKDRTLLISSVSKQNGTTADSSLITLNLTVKNTSSKAIMNQATFFQLTGSEGDIFTYQYNSSDNFYGSVPVNGSHTGTIVFQLPAAAAHNLHLLYRPEVATETALVALSI